MDRALQARKFVHFMADLTVFLLGIAITIIPVQAGSDPPGSCAHLTGKIDLMKFADWKAWAQRGIVEAGEGVSMTLAPMKKGEYNQLTVQDRGKTVATLQDIAYFTKCSRLEMGQARYWVVESWSYGVHCCYTHYFFCREQEGRPLRFLGKVKLGHAQAEDNDWGNLSQKQIICLKGQPHIQYIDNRFAYGMDDFETSYAGSTVMFFPVFYRLSPKGLNLSNKSFKEEYRRRIVVLDKVIKEKGEKGPHFTTVKGYVGFYGADELWILITARTINYLVAREESQAWQTLKRDMKKYYGTINGLENLKKKIKATMAAVPY